MALCVQVRCRLTCGLEMFAKDRDAHERDVCPSRLVRGSINELRDSVIETQGTDGGASLPTILRTWRIKHGMDTICCFLNRVYFLFLT